MRINHFFSQTIFDIILLNMVLVASLELRSMFRKAVNLLMEEILIRKEVIDFLKKRKFEAELQVEYIHLQAIRDKMQLYWSCSANGTVEEAYENIANIFDIKAEHIEYPNITNDDLELIKRLHNYCEIHKVTDCNCNTYFIR